MLLAIAGLMVSCSLFTSSRREALPHSDGRVAGGETSRRLVLESPAAGQLGLLVWPVRLAKVSSRYGMRDGRFHSGVDIYKPLGTPVLAAHTGKVIYSGDSGTDYGTMIILKGKGLITVYAHNDENLVKVGDAVTQGDEIGRVGESGNATGPHVHFETRITTPEGRVLTVDPQVFFPKGDGKPQQ